MTKLSFYIFIAVFIFASCKKRTNLSSSVKKYENELGDICELIGNEANTLAETSQEALETIQLRIIDRERDILEALIQKASVCQTKKDLTDLECNAILSNAIEFSYAQKIKDLSTNCNVCLLYTSPSPRDS